MWTNEEHKRVFARIESLEREMVEMQCALTAIPALSPEAGGEGEEKKAALLGQLTTALNPDVLEIVAAPDDRVPSGRRPSVVAVWHGGNRGKTVWVMTHTDVVAPGDLKLWRNDPYTVVEQDGILYGRGVEDNQQSLVASFFAVKCMLQCGLQGASNVGLLFVADEEVGSRYGIEYILRERPDLFAANDLVLVPDTGSEDGSMIEVAEKSLLWMKFTVKGKQCHASMPQLGKNAHRAGAALITAVDKALHSSFAAEDALFRPPGSTFEPTKKERNVDSVNIVPAEDVFFLDCRVLPGIPLSAVHEVLTAEARKVESTLGVTVSMESVQSVQAPPATPVESEIVRKLTRALEQTRNVKGRPQGIGGGTVASFYRRRGIPVAVWGTIEETAHQPNEHCKISNMIADSKVFAHIFAQD